MDDSFFALGGDSITAMRVLQNSVTVFFDKNSCIEMAIFLLRHKVRTRMAVMEAIGMDDSFFALGGDSITAMRVLTLCRRRNMAISMLPLAPSLGNPGVSGAWNQRPGPESE
jgi:aryl carrier-like protein